jgi:cellulose synthase/poly-beta-1,6-N-acetylglucosamine synthase-like glycosyltransferase
MIVATRLPTAVVVPTYNDCVRLARLLDTLDALDPAPAEVAVVDDGSTDNTAALLRQWASRPHAFAAAALSTGSNSGPAGARTGSTNCSLRPGPRNERPWLSRKRTVRRLLPVFPRT